VAGKMLGMVATAPNKLAGLRDRALLLVGFGGALRRSELVALDVANIEETETGLLVKIRCGKTDQERAGATRLLKVTWLVLRRRCGNGWTRLGSWIG
jgi:site-specific recombinase XerC